MTARDNTDFYFPTGHMQSHANQWPYPLTRCNIGGYPQASCSDCSCGLTDKLCGGDLVDHPKESSLTIPTQVKQRNITSR